MRVISSHIRLSKIFMKVFHTEDIMLSNHIGKINTYDKYEASELIETILLDVPIQAFYMYELRDGRKKILDGNKRLIAILDFMDNSFALSGLHFLSQFNGMHFSELPPLIRSRIENFEITTHTITPPASPDVLNSLIKRLNK